MNGSDKLPLFVIGKSKRSLCLQNVTVPVEYTSNKKAWMIGALFEDWMRKLDITHHQSVGRTKYFSRSFSHAVLSIWNGPLNEIRSLSRQSF